MFLRWMVRKDSEVDLGLWKELKQDQLLIPCDTHVLNTAKELGIIDKSYEILSYVIRLTKYAKKVFPSDPSKMDFALYGYGINKTK